jgi:hypothetical protein
MGRGVRRLGLGVCGGVSDKVESFEWVDFGAFLPRGVPSFFKDRRFSGEENITPAATSVGSSFSLVAVVAGGGGGRCGVWGD